MLWHLYHTSFSSPPAGSKRGFFSDIHHENLAKFLKVKFTKVWVHPITGFPPEFSLSVLSRLTPQQLINFSSDFPSLPWFPQRCLLSGFSPVSCDFRYLSLSSFRGSGWSCDLTSLMNLRRVIDFSVCSAFSFGGEGPPVWHMEVPRLGAKLELELQLPAYSTAHQILNPLSEARDQTHILMDTSWVRFH